ncbi:helix-turn-helix transcriptional regulator [Raineyella sp. LH-20]|uniref:helix-turn-helix transcriptional regulator n=1 Tax=Raineyella sp. LH-20 TaxID=3081204 RepID=UPI002952B265|nr:LuxR C-terminal-related transcriptional regulator [Raineyella sp. LH-20]WOP17266.1 LuxR C-terminal-related transcriptional regulator [Raineyella sp. LH-20]
MQPAESPLIGRERELRTLIASFAGALAGAPAVIVVAGTAHVGTTALVAEAVRRARRAVPGARELRLRGLVWERRLPGEFARRLCAAADGPAGVRSAEPAPAIGADPQAATAAILDRLRDCSAGGLLVVVEDAQHADPASLRAISSAVERLTDAPVAVVLEVTAEETADPELATVLRAHRADTVVVGGLGADAVRDLARSRGQLLSPDAARRLAAFTGGLPGLVVELLDEFPGLDREASYDALPAPRSVRQELAAVLGEATPDVRDLVTALAVSGPGTPAIEVAALAGLADMLPAIDEARARGLLQVRSHQDRLTLTFTNPMLAAAAYEALDLVTRRRLHLAAADRAGDEFDRAQHLFAAGQGPDAPLAERTAALAETYAADGRWRRAADSWVLASRGHPDRDLSRRYLVLALDAMTGSGDLHAAEALAAEVEAFPGNARRDVALGYLATLKARRGAAEQLLHRAMDEAGDDPEAEAVGAHRLSLHALGEVDGEALVTWGERCLAAADRLGRPGLPAAVEAHTLLGLGLGMAGRVADAEAAYRRTLEALATGAQRQRALMGHGWLELAWDRPQQAIQDFQAAIPQGFWQGSSRVALWASGWLARAHLEVGEWDSAMAVVERAQDLLDRTGMDLIAPLIHWTGAEICALRGQSAEADWHVSQALAVSSEYMITRLPTAMARTRVAQARSDADGSLHAMEPIATADRPASVDEPGFWPWHDMWASALSLTGRLDEADRFLRPHEERARQAGRHSAMARLAMGRGRLTSLRGDIEEARRSFEEALALVEASPYFYLRTRINFLYGQALRRAGKRREAGVVLRRALDGFSAVGATVYVERCHRELQAGGAGGTRSAGLDVESLTAQEQAVARLVARGLSNADVARELFISVKTVQFHLTRIYSKLGVRSRTELAAHRGELSDSTG